MDDHTPYDEDDDRQEYWDALDAHESNIFVNLECCAEQVREDTVKFLNIEEDMLGRDVLTFRCPRCGQIHRSLRIG